MNIIMQGSLLTALLIAVAISDDKTRAIPPKFCVGIALLTLLDFRWENLLGLCIALIVYICAVWICPDRFGGGDIKLITGTSLILGFYGTAYGIIIAFTLEIIKFLIMSRKITKQEVSQTGLPLAPFLAVGFLITYFMKIGGFFV